MTNLWAESATETPIYPLLESDIDVDLLIVGGGFSGCAAALEAAQMGARVCLLEAQAVGFGGSGRNVGLVNAGLWLPPNEVMAQMGDVAGARLITALAKAPDHVFEIIQKEQITCEATRNGTLHLAHAASGWRDLERRYAQGMAWNAPVSLLNATQTAHRVGSNTYHGALFDPRAGTIQPMSYCRGLAKAAVAKGAQIYEGSAVTDLQQDGGAWVTRAAGGTVKADAVIVATNAYGTGRAVKTDFVPFHYCQFATDPLPSNIRERILAGGEGCWDTALVMSSFRLDAAGRLILGGVGNADGPGGRIHHNWARRKLKQIFPDLAGLRFAHHWTGQIAMTGDHIPKILNFGPKALAVFGYSGRGIAPGTVFGTSMARALLGGDETQLPVVPIAQHKERYIGIRAAYYETGAIAAHALPTKLI